MNFPQVNLQPGATGTAVKQLQDYLVSVGAMTQAQVNTGYGTYGPQTTAAVAKWQQENNVQTGGNSGYWGPLSIAAATNTASGKTTSSTPASTTGTTTSTPVGVPYNPQLANYGITPQTYAQGNATQQAVWNTTIAGVNTLNATPVSSITPQMALTAAQNDPNITKPYTDALALDTESFNQSLQQIQTATSTTAQQQQQQFETERKALAEQQAGAGTAYSGFREQAQNNLAQTESGIVTSSQSQLQQQLNQLTSGFESKYGTAATPQATVNYINPFTSANATVSGQYNATGNVNASATGQTAGNITGSQANAPGGAEYAAINAGASAALNQGVTPTVTT